MDNKKRSLGQYFTKGNQWLCPQVEEFIQTCKATIAYDPFAGDGSLLRSIKHIINNHIGLDIDPAFGWQHNDSLESIPHVSDAVIITNPPYISNYSAKRKCIDLERYFKKTRYNDLYMLALDNMLSSQEFIVAIVPETFINSAYSQKNRLKSITILENNPFVDTEVPVVVLCFNEKIKSYCDIKVYKNEKYLCSLQDVENNRLFPSNSVKMTFNSTKGWLAVRCIDSTNPKEKIRFAFKEDIDYDWNEGIKPSSRLMTLIDLRIPKEKQEQLINQCNLVLNRIRKNSHDIIFSPFKGNTTDGVRRRRLDFLTCRAIIEKAYADVFFSCIPFMDGL